MRKSFSKDFRLFTLKESVKLKLATKQSRAIQEPLRVTVTAGGGGSIWYDLQTTNIPDARVDVTNDKKNEDAAERAVAFERTNLTRCSTWKRSASTSTMNVADKSSCAFSITNYPKHDCCFMLFLAGNSELCFVVLLHCYGRHRLVSRPSNPCRVADGLSTLDDFRRLPISDGIFRCDMGFSYLG
jgi:hypothetical protein